MELVLSKRYICQAESPSVESTASWAVPADGPGKGERMRVIVVGSGVVGASCA